jgi:hypothetical protein
VPADRRSALAAEREADHEQSRARVQSPPASERKILSDADLELYADLRTQVQALQDPGEKIEIPEPNGAGSWQILYATYRALKRRSEVDRDPAATQWAANNSLAEEEWNRFAVERVTFLEWLQRASW